MTDAVERPLPTCVTQAIARVMGEIGGIEKLNATQRAQRARERGQVNRGDSDGIDYAYRGIDQITAAAVDLLYKYGVIFVPHVRTDEITRGLGRNGNMTEHLMTVDWMIYGPGGRDDYINATTVGESRDSGDKGANKAQTAAFKNLLLRVLCITDPADDTDNYDTRDHGGPPQQRRENVPAGERAPEVDAAELTTLFEKLKPQQRVKVQRYAAQVLGIREFNNPGEMSGELALAMRNVLEGREAHEGPPAPDPVDPALPESDITSGDESPHANDAPPTGPDQPQDGPPPPAADPPQPVGGPAGPDVDEPPMARPVRRGNPKTFSASPDDGHTHDYKKGECTLCGKEEPF